MRPIDFGLTDQWTQHSGLPSPLVSTSHEARQALLWWTSPAHLRGIPFTLPDVDWRLFSNASTEGWGAQFNGAPGRGFVDTGPKHSTSTIGAPGSGLSSQAVPAHGEILSRLYVFADQFEAPSGGSDELVIGAISGGQVREAVGAFHADLFVNDENHKLPVYAFPPTGRVSLEGGRVLFPENVPVGVRVPTGS